MLHRILLLSILLFLAGMLGAQSSHSLLRDGDKAYDREEYSIAEESYRKAKSQGAIGKGAYNLGNTVYQQGRYDEAVDHYRESVSRLTDPKDKSEALFNLGNAQLEAAQLEDAIVSYKEALDQNPADDAIRQNLYVAKLMRIQQQQEEQKQQQQSEQEEDDENQEDEKQQQQQGQGDQPDQQQQPSEQDSEQEGKEQQEQQMDLSKEDAEKLLQVIENEEKNVQEKLRKSYGNKKKPKKDW